LRQNNSKHRSQAAPHPKGFDGIKNILKHRLNSRLQALRKIWNLMVRKAFNVRSQSASNPNLFPRCHRARVWFKAHIPEKLGQPVPGFIKSKTAGIKISFRLF
jgi:hypothetical protein